jgi:DNA-3-methyladenine glycosylase II
VGAAEPGLRCTIALPPDFRPDAVLAFHRRDPQQRAERVDADGFAKGLAWRGRPACLAVRFHEGLAEAGLVLDGEPAAGDRAALESLVRRMLGLDQAVDVFEAAYRPHPQLGPLIARHPGLRVPLAATPFEALAWAVTGQQISVGAAVALRRRLIEAAGLAHSGGLACHPDAARLAAVEEAQLRAAGFSAAKARCLLTLGERVAEGTLPLEAWAEEPPVADIRARLLAIRGIGPWTVDYVLLRGFGWLDGSLHGDAAVRRGLQALLGRAERPSEDETRRWLAGFSPWRALIAAHLWANQPATGY